MVVMIVSSVSAEYQLKECSGEADEMCGRVGKNIMKWLNLVSDLVITLAFFIVPCQIFYFQKLFNRQPFYWIIWIVEAFLLCSAFVHVFSIWNILTGRVAELVVSRMLAAIMSAITAIVIVRIIPAAFSLPARNAALEQELGLMQVEYDALSKLRRATQNIRQTLDEKMIYFATVKECCSCWKVCHACILVENEEEGFYSCVADYSKEQIVSSCQVWKNIKIPCSSQVLQDVLRNARSLILNNDQLKQLKVPEMMKPFQIMIVPFVLSDERSGFLVLETRAETTLQENFLIEDVVGQVTIALNQSLYLRMETVRLRQIAEQLKENLALEKAKNEAEAANFLKSEFVATISHEIRTPMNAIIGFLDILSSSELSVDQRETLNVIIENSQCLLALLNDILDFSRIESGCLKLTNEPFSISDCIENAAELMIDHAERKGLVLNISIAKDIPSMVLGDSLRLRQILLNLISNAIKFTDYGFVEILLSSKNTEREVQTICCSVHDTGIGISEDHIGLLFKKFSQVDSSSSRRYTGAGLGLAICAKLIELFKGKIDVESKIGAGSTFSFEIPFIVLDASSPFNIIHDISNSLQNDILFAVIDELDPRKNRLVNLLENFGLSFLYYQCFSSFLTFLMRRNVKLIVLISEAIFKSICGPGKEFLSYCQVYVILKHGTTFRFENSGISGQIVAPVKRADIANLLYKVLGFTADSKKDEKDKVASVSLHSICILTVDDNFVNQKVTKRLIQAIGISKILQAFCGNEAVQLVKDNSDIDLILMDLSMPEMDGITATKIIKKIRPEIKIIALTANVMNEDKKACLKAGMVDFLCKPLQKCQLEEAIKKQFLSIN